MSHQFLGSAEDPIIKGSIKILLGGLTILAMTLQACIGASPQTKPRIAPAGSEQDGMEMVFIPAGHFGMGSAETDENASPDEKPQREVYLDAFWIDRTEVTNTMFARFINETAFQTRAETKGSSIVYQAPSWSEVPGTDWNHPQGPESNTLGLQDHPVVNVSWEDAAAYCEWAGRRLPTEAEWEKAARGPDENLYPWGEKPLRQTYLNYADLHTGFSWYSRKDNDGYKFTAPVGAYPEGSSFYGVFDMAGNVWEWVSDWYDRAAYSRASSSNPTGPAYGTERVLRGGSWMSDLWSVRSANRSRYLPETTRPFVGFRCAKSAGTDSGS